MGRIVIAWETGPKRAWVSPAASDPRAPSWYSSGPHESWIAAIRAARADGIEPTHYMVITADTRHAPVRIEESNV